MNVDITETSTSTWTITAPTVKLYFTEYSDSSGLDKQQIKAGQIYNSEIKVMLHYSTLMQRMYSECGEIK